MPRREQRGTRLGTSETLVLAGFGDGAQARDELVEWDYGEYEGLTDAETERGQPGWDLFRDGCPGGERPKQVEERVDRFLRMLGGQEGECLLVAHGKLLRALASRWIGQGVALGSALAMDPAAISLLEREAQVPLLRLWNFTGQPKPRSSDDGATPGEQSPVHFAEPPG